MNDGPTGNSNQKKLETRINYVYIIMLPYSIGFFFKLGDKLTFQKA